MAKHLDRAVVILRCHRLLDEAGVGGTDGRRSLLDRVRDLIAERDRLKDAKKDPGQDTGC